MVKEHWFHYYYLDQKVFFICKCNLKLSHAYIFKKTVFQKILDAERAERKEDPKVGNKKKTVRK